MKRHDLINLMFLTVTFCMGAGCDSNPFDPPRPPELTASPAGETIGTERGGLAAPSEAKGPAPAAQSPSSSGALKPQLKGIELVLSRQKMTVGDYLAQVLRREAGKRALSFRLTQPEPSNPMTPARLAQVIRKAAGLGFALVLEPQDAPEVCKALEEFKATGPGVLLLDDSLSCPGDASSYHRIVFTGFPSRAGAIVEAALEDASARAFPKDGPIAILRNRTTDAYSAQRHASLAEAVTRAKRSFDVVDFNGTEPDARVRLGDYLKAHPRPAIVLADDHTGLLGAFKVHAELTKQGLPVFVLGGFALMDIRIGFPDHTACIAFAYQDLDEYSLKAAEIVVDISRGKSVPIQFESELAFVRTGSTSSPAGSTGKSGLPRAHTFTTRCWIENRRPLGDL